jgi:hypothetical protein
MVEILEGTLLPPELQKSEHIGGKRVPVTGLGHLHSCLASRDSIFVNSDIALVNIMEIICWRACLPLMAVQSSIVVSVQGLCTHRLCLGLPCCET